MPVKNESLQSSANEQAADDPLYTQDGAKEYLNLTSTRWLQLDRSTKRRIPFIKIGHFIRYKKSDLDAFIDSCRVGGGAS